MIFLVKLGKISNELRGSVDKGVPQLYVDWFKTGPQISFFSDVKFATSDRYLIATSSAFKWLSFQVMKREILLNK